MTLGFDSMNFDGVLVCVMRFDSCVVEEVGWLEEVFYEMVHAWCYAYCKLSFGSDLADVHNSL